MDGFDTLSHAIDRFLDYQKTRKGRTATTINTYRSALGIFLVFTGDIPISELSVKHVDDYADSLTGLMPKTLRNRLTPIRSMIGYLYSKDATNVRKESIDLPAVSEIEANFLDYDEQEQMIAVCQDEREKALILILISSGLRVSELINARTDDLFERSLIVRVGKGGKPRVTFITLEAEIAVNIYHEHLTYAQTYLFPSEGGSKISRQYIARLVTGIARRAGITKKVSPHTLRHTFATNLLRAGARIEDVQPMMGHANMRTTRIYMHFTNDYLKGRYDEVMQKASV